MINAIENAIDVVRKAARDQSDSIVRELNADYDARNVALTVYNNALQQVRAIREQADGLERAAQDAFNSAMTSSGGVTLAIVNQINHGEMVSSVDSPSQRSIAQPQVS